MPERSAEPGDDGGMRYEREPARRLPRWAKLAGIVVAVLILLAIIVMLMSPGDGGHGPRRHGADPVAAAGSRMER